MAIHWANHYHSYHIKLSYRTSSPDQKQSLWETAYSDLWLLPNAMLPSKMYPPSEWFIQLPTHTIPGTTQSPRIGKMYIIHIKMILMPCVWGVVPKSMHIHTKDRAEHCVSSIILLRQSLLLDWKLTRLGCLAGKWLSKTPSLYLLILGLQEHITLALHVLLATWPSPSLPTIFWGKVSVWPMSTRDLPGIASAHWITGTSHYAQVFVTWMLGSEVRSFCLYVKHFSDRTSFPPYFILVVFRTPSTKQ